MKETEKKSIIELLDSMLRENPVELCGVLASTNLLVLETLDRLEYSAVRNASIRTYLTCDNSEMEYLLNDFDALVVLAKDTPEFFARKLHSYCEKMAERIQMIYLPYSATQVVPTGGLLDQFKWSELGDLIRNHLYGAIAYDG